MGSIDIVKGIIVGIILIAAGVLMMDPSTGLPLLVNVGWIFLIGGIILVGVSIYSVIKG